MNGISIDWRGFKFTLHSASIYYLGGVDPDLQWEVRGISGHDLSHEKTTVLDEQKKNAIGILLKTPEGQKKTQSFAAETVKVMEGLLKDGRKYLFNYLGKREFKLVLGAMRTGGTYLYKEISNIHGQKWDTLNLEMTHDSIPQYGALADWNRVEVFNHLLFEMAQYFVWVKREIDSPVVVQKRIAYAHALPFLNGLFGDSVEYILTIRHPIPLAYSFARVTNQNLEKGDSETPALWRRLVANGGNKMSVSEWDSLSYFQKTLFYWGRYYSDVASASAFSQRVHVVRFGEDIDGYLKSCSEKSGVKEYQPEGFNYKVKPYNGELNQDELSAVIGSVKRKWEANGLIFPELSNI